MNKSYLLVVAVLAAAVLGYVTFVKFFDEPAPIEPPAVASVPPSRTLVDFALPDLDGNVRRISDWDGKSRLINFWATWCAPCRREIPLLKKMQADYAEDNLQVIGVAVDFVEEVTAFAEEVEFNYPVLVGQDEAMAAAEASGIEFIGLPFTMIVAADGQLIKVHIGEIGEQDIELIVDVFGQMRNGELDPAGARSALKAL